ncbi:MAG: c-type cytochrome [Chitinophagaceae bacterium]|nr:MAG: c-type cytochrome [Chitinophagaceae bacterium]
MKRTHLLRSGLLALLALGMGSAAFAQEAAGAATDAAAPAPSTWFNSDKIFIYIFLTLFLLVGIMIVHILWRVNQMVLERLGKVPKAKPAKAPGQPGSLKAWWARIDAKYLTRAIPVHEEQDRVLDHEYDGIRELDNALPPWWKWGFYISVIAAFIYMYHYQFGSGPNPEQEYTAEMKVAAAEVEAYRLAAKDNVDEKSVTMADAAGVEAGKVIYQKNCFMCHGAAGEGGVGPNLTDEFWLHGGSINDVFHTIKYGYPDKGMQAWEKMFSPVQIRELSSFVMSLNGTKPPNGKAPQGDIYVDNGAAKKDSAAPVAAK